MQPCHNSIVLVAFETYQFWSVAAFWFSLYFFYEQTDNFVEEFIQQSLLPLTLPISGESLKLLKDDKRKIVLTIVEDETHYESKALIKLLRAAASANREFVFAYVGYNQWKDFAEAFEVGKKTPLPKMVVWDGNEVFFTVSCKCL